MADNKPEWLTVTTITHTCARVCVYRNGWLRMYYEYHMDPAHNYSLFPQQGLFPKLHLAENEYFAINIRNVISIYLLFVYLITILVAHVL
jgi:hypothetical protein